MERHARESLAHVTGEQRAKIPALVERWVDQGLAVAPADRSRAEDAIRACYRFASLGSPDAVLWVPSPLAGVLEWPRVMRARHPSAGRHSVHALPLAAEVIERLGELPPEVLFGSTLDEEIASATSDRVLSALLDRVDRGLAADLWHEIWEVVNTAVGWSVDEPVSGALEEMLEQERYEHWRGRLGGSWWCAMQAYTSFFREVCGLSLPGDLWERERAFAEAQSAGWWWPHRRFVLVSERPIRISLDEQGRLHNTSGPAVAWSDGFGLWFWHGRRIDGPSEAPYVRAAAAR